MHDVTSSTFTDIYSTSTNHPQVTFAQTLHQPFGIYLPFRFDKETTTMFSRAAVAVRRSQPLTARLLHSTPVASKSVTEKVSDTVKKVRFINSYRLWSWTVAYIWVK